MLRDAAYELDGSNKSSVNFSCVTTSARLVVRDEIPVFITAPDADYAALEQEAKMVRNTTMSLSRILGGMPTDWAPATSSPSATRWRVCASCTSARRSTQRNNALLGQSGHPERGCPLFRCTERSEYYLQIHGRLAIMGYKRTSLII